MENPFPVNGSWEKFLLYSTPCEMSLYGREWLLRLVWSQLDWEGILGGRVEKKARGAGLTSPGGPVCELPAERGAEFRPGLGFHRVMLKMSQALAGT